LIGGNSFCDAREPLEGFSITELEELRPQNAVLSEDGRKLALKLHHGVMVLFWYAVNEELDVTSSLYFLCGLNFTH